MSTRIHLAVDAMGGDFGPSVTVPASLQVLSRHPLLEITLVGQRRVLEPFLRSVDDSLRSRLRLEDAEQVVSMDDIPSSALRHKKQSSMRLAIECVAAGQADACVSAGNTGALMAMGWYVLKMLDGIDRPAICSVIPTVSGHAYLLDVGANVDSPAESLYQFAVMGSALCAALDGVPRPRVALLNIGEEQNKGNEQVRLGHARLQQATGLNYVGFVEGDDLYSGQADVIVCDGFAGNIALKASEGTARLVARLAREVVGGAWWTRVLALVAAPLLRRMVHAIDPAGYNGACLLGLRGVVVKSHGGADVAAFGNALERAMEAVRTRMLARISERLAHAVRPE